MVFVENMLTKVCNKQQEVCSQQAKGEVCCFGFAKVMWYHFFRGNGESGRRRVKNFTYYSFSCFSASIANFDTILQLVLIFPSQSTDTRSILECFLFVKSKHFGAGAFSFYQFCYLKILHNLTATFIV